MLDPKLQLMLRSLTSLIYVVTNEEDRAIRDIHTTLTAGSNKKHQSVVWVYNEASGLVDAGALKSGWENRSMPVDTETKGNPMASMSKVYGMATKQSPNFYIFTDPQVLLKNDTFVRRTLNVLHQGQVSATPIKILIFVGPVLRIPAPLMDYMHVVRSSGLTDGELREAMGPIAAKINVPEDIHTTLRGLTGNQVATAVRQSIVSASTPEGEAKQRSINPESIRLYKQERIEKTGLLELIEPDVTFDQIGGLDRFKAWATRTQHSWTTKGKAYGLTPPKGVLCVGVWGCGKSLSVKALGAAWNLPIIKVELGKLRNSMVGKTEENTYLITRYLEEMAPCIAWFDEAEKSFSGAESSAQSDAGTASRTLGILSTWHQETKAEVCIALTANNLQTLPVEFTNRIDERFFFDLPSEDDRVEILKIQLVAEGHLTEEALLEFDLRKLAQDAEGLVPREMGQAIKAALVESFHQDTPGLDFEVTRKILASKPRILKTMDAELAAVVNWVGIDPETGEGLRARFASTRQPTKTTKILAGGA